ncbi:MAG: nucleoside deaminase [Spirochaetales bacterium]|nr:nucleoside deaminase [Spirochaetales bacterium]
MDAKHYMRLAIERARETMNKGLGGPFGAVVVDRSGQVFVASNSVLGDHDPTAHAEINAIRMACEANGTHDLTGAVLYATGHPCPMCLSACIWANIKDVYYAARAEDAEKIGFRDDYIYHYIEGGHHDRSVLTIEEVDRAEALKLYEEYAEMEHTLY